MKQILQTTKHDSKAKTSHSRMTKRRKLAFLQYYNSQMQLGADREKILTTLTRKMGVGQRQVERILEQAANCQRDIDKHFLELSTTALNLANNLNSFLTKNGEELESTIIGDIVYKGWLDVIGEEPDGLSIKMRDVDKKIASNLLLHLKGEFPELVDITDWGQLDGNQISHDLIGRLEVKAGRGDFIGKCLSCPK